MTPLRYSASIMCASLLRLEDDLNALEAAQCDELHFDIMDGVFVPNITLGFDIVRAATRACRVPASAHLMLIKPEPYIQRFIECGCSSITVHVETCPHLVRTLGMIRDAGASPGVAINPATPLTKLEYALDFADRILVMTVDPGYAGQKLIPSAFERVRILRENISYRELKRSIEVDGNIDAANAATLANCGADRFVLGTSAIFTGQGDAGAALRGFKREVAKQRLLV